ALPISVEGIDRRPGRLREVCAVCGPVGVIVVHVDYDAPHEPGRVDLDVAARDRLGARLAPAARLQVVRDVRRLHEPARIEERPLCSPSRHAHDSPTHTDSIAQPQSELTRLTLVVM